MEDQGAGVDARSGLHDHPDKRRAAERGPVSAADAPRDFYRELDALRQQLIERYSKLGAVMTTWPTHPDGAPKRLGELSPAMRRAVVAEVVKKFERALHAIQKGPAHEERDDDQSGGDRKNGGSCRGERAPLPQKLSGVAAQPIPRNPHDGRTGSSAP